MLAQPPGPSSSMTFSTLSFHSAHHLEGRQRVVEKWRFSRTDGVHITTLSCRQYWRARRNTTDMENGDPARHQYIIHSQTSAKGLTNTSDSQVCELLLKSGCMDRTHVMTSVNHKHCKRSRKALYELRYISLMAEMSSLVGQDVRSSLVPRPSHPSICHLQY